MSITFTTQIELENCCKCGIQFGIQAGFQRERKNDHQMFYCPNGHGQYYSGANETERLRKQLAQEQHRREQIEAERTRMRDERDAAERRASAARGRVTRLKNRAANGVCPCCNRSFQDLRRHMETKHPDFAKAEA